MEDAFRDFLKEEGYSEYTPSGNKSTVYDYSKRVNRICQWENCTWEELVARITEIVRMYDVGGEKEDIGSKSNHAYINALRAFQRFVNK